MPTGSRKDVAPTAVRLGSSVRRVARRGELHQHMPGRFVDSTEGGYIAAKNANLDVSKMLFLGIDGLPDKNGAIVSILQGRLGVVLRLSHWRCRGDRVGEQDSEEGREAAEE